MWMGQERSKAKCWCGPHSLALKQCISSVSLRGCVLANSTNPPPTPKNAVHPQLLCSDIWTLASSFGLHSVCQPLSHLDVLECCLTRLTYSAWWTFARSLARYNICMAPSLAMLEDGYVLWLFQHSVVYD